jgi:hypothetical protein
MPSTPAPGHHILSGPEIVSQFIKNLKNDAALNKEIVTAIETLAANDKLNAPNLQKALNDLRGASAI